MNQCNFCSSCGTKLNDENTRSLKVDAFLEVGDYNKAGEFDWESDQALLVCLSCEAVNVAHSCLPLLSEVERLEK